MGFSSAISNCDASESVINGGKSHGFDLGWPKSRGFSFQLICLQTARIVHFTERVRLRQGCTPGNAFKAFGVILHLDRRSEEHTSELQSQSNLVCRLLLEKKKKQKNINK